jgi:hypothetical protein
MSAVQHTTIFCDGTRAEGRACGNWVIGDDAKDARRDARRSGWRTGLPGGKDYCRTHRETAGRHGAAPETGATNTGPGTVTP